MSSYGASPSDTLRGVVVICVGNPLRGDDAVGPRAAAALEPAGGDWYELLVAHQLAPEMALPLSRARLAIVIDAATDLAPGVIRRRRIGRPLRPAPGGALGHHHDIDSLLSMARSAFGGAAETWELTVGGQSWELGRPLSPVVSAAIPRVLHNVDLIIACRLPARPRSPGLAEAALIRS